MALKKKTEMKICRQKDSMNAAAYRKSVWPIVHNRASVVSCPKVLDLSQVIPAAVIINNLSQTIKIFKSSQILN